MEKFLDDKGVEYIVRNKAGNVYILDNFVDPYVLGTAEDLAKWGYTRVYPDSFASEQEQEISSDKEIR